MTRIFALAAALALALALSSPALGGSWAVTTLDTVPDSFEAGRSYDLGYTIRQHGVTPVDLASTGIRITSVDSGKATTFDGRRDGPVGHYVVRVSFPAAGGWTWEAMQDWFGPQALGKLQVVAPSAASAPGAGAAAVPVSAPAAPPPAPNMLLIAGLLVALAGAAVLFGGSIATATSRARTAGGASRSPGRASAR